jgi:hypothetical protein
MEQNKRPDDLVDIGPGGFISIQGQKTEEKPVQQAAPSDMVSVDPDYVESQVDLLNPVTKAAAVGAAARPLVKKVLGMNEQTGRQSLETYLKSQIHHKYPGLNLDALEKEVQKIYGPQARVSTMAEVQAALNAVQGPVFGKPTVDLSPYSKNILTGKTRAGQGEMLLKSVGENINPITGQGFGAKTMRTAGRGVIGGAAGVQGASAYNRWQEGDMPGAATSGVGALGAALLTSRNPKAKGAGAILQGLSLPGQFMREEKEGYKEGGLVHLAKGKAVSDALKKFNFDKFKMSEVYPDVIPPVMATDAKTGKQFLQKQLSPEAIDVQKARKLAQKEIDLGRYEPFFDIEKRFYADPSRYQLAGTTLTDIVPKKADTIAKYEQLANQPESLLRLRGAFDVAKDRPLAKDWYAMGQLEKEFIRELGPVEGPKQFRARFADAMAATTGGADPNSNLMMSAFTNYQKGLGKEIPTTAADLPFPIGGRFVSGNMEQAKKLQDLGLIPVTNPKRHNFSANFLGYRDRSTLDEQMSQLWDPKMMAPPPNAYGIYEQALAKEAKRAGVEPANFQDIAWAGAKNYPGKPMIREINEMLARTNMITGEPQEEILKGFIKGNKPMYGIAGAGAGVSLDDEEKASGGLVGYKEGGSTTPAWQRSEGKSPSGGLNALGRASYKRETGGELKAPQPEGGSRKKSFCARMGGMKKKLTSSETANDPDSRINKALRKWKC